jgi:hypothetical protein
MFNKNQYALPSLIIAAGIVLSAIIIGGVWKNISKANQTITVTGSAKKIIVSDLGILRGTISAQSYSAVEAFKNLNSQKPQLLKYLKTKGFDEDKVQFFTINSYPIYEISSQGMQTNNIVGFNYSQRMEIQSNDVKKIQAISLEISSLVERGVNFMIEQPEYHYSKMAEVKIDIQARAAKDAMIRAQKIAEATDGTLGTMKSARMGVLQITPRNSNMVSDYGVNDLSSIEKEITAVVNASFEIN